MTQPVSAPARSWFNGIRCTFPRNSAPLLMVVIDTEEEFDWTQPFSRSAIGTESLRYQARAQDIFDRYGLVPTYVVDYPVATSPHAGTLHDFSKTRRCHIGAHLHPWVNPPYQEQVTTWNSYPGNLGAELEERKLTELTQAIEQGFGARPILYKAGRYGVGPYTAGILRRLGYEIDLSVVPHTSFSSDGGPDFVGLHDTPYWIGPDRSLFEIPLSRGFTGLGARLGPRHFQNFVSPPLSRLHLAGIGARLHLLERLTLTPEGFALNDLKRLTRAMRNQGHSIFSLTYHSPSLLPGCTPYVRTETDLAAFLQCIEGYLAFFMNELRGRPGTPFDVRRLAVDSAQHEGN